MLVDFYFFRFVQLFLTLTKIRFVAHKEVFAYGFVSRFVRAVTNGNSHFALRLFQADAAKRNAFVMPVFVQLFLTLAKIRFVAHKKFLSAAFLLNKNTVQSTVVQNR